MLEIMRQQRILCVIRECPKSTFATLDYGHRQVAENSILSQMITNTAMIAPIFIAVSTMQWIARQRQCLRLKVRIATKKLCLHLIMSWRTLSLQFLRLMPLLPMWKFLGGEQTIRRHQPVVMLEYGCKLEYLLETPRLLSSYGKDYRLYLRQKNIFGDSKTILYVIPSK